jgi:hypothetical protein
MTLYAVGRRFVVAVSLFLLFAAHASAVQVTLNVVQSQSHILLNGDFGGTEAAPANPFAPQDSVTFPTPGTTDNDPTRPSNQTTFTGTITVDVDNVLAPTTIQILSADLDAAVSGSWLPEPQPDAGAPSDTDPPDPATPANLGIKLVAFECCDFAYATVRGFTYNVVTEDPDTHVPVIEPVNAQGEFSSLSQHIHYSQGFFDYWVDPFTLNERERDDLTGDGGLNQHVYFNDPAPGETVTPIPDAPKSTYVVSGNLATLTIPVEMSFDQPGDLSQYVDGQFVATFEIPSGQDGDYNEDGIVDGADYVAWRKTPSDFGNDPAGYNTWRQNFGEGGAGGGGAVPEPASALLVVFGLISLSMARGRHNGGPRI